MKEDDFRDKCQILSLNLNYIPSIYKDIIDVL